MEKNTIILSEWEAGIKEIPDSSVHLICSDPPFVMSQHGGAGFLREQKRIKNTFSEIAKYSTLDFDITPYLAECLRICNPFNAYFFCNQAMLETYITFAKENNFNCRLLIWKKLNPMPLYKSDYSHGLEFIVRIWKRRGGVCWNNKLKPKSRYHDVLEYAVPNNKKKLKHPNQKPLDLIKNLIELSSAPGQMIFDGFMGSGTTGAAALLLGREFIGFERDSEYHALAMERILKLQSVPIPEKLTLFDHAHQL